MKILIITCPHDYINDYIIRITRSTIIFTIVISTIIKTNSILKQVIVI